MRISDEFTVHAPARRVWRLLTDVEATAPCVPGARLTGVDGDLYSGAVRVKVGPLVAAYSGTARFTELDGVAYRAVVEASGRASRGAGGAAATVTVRLRPEGMRTLVTVDTDLRLTGRLAELDAETVGFTSALLVDRFAAALEERYGFAPSGAAGAGPTGDTGEVPAGIEAPGTPGAHATDESGGTTGEGTGARATGVTGGTGPGSDPGPTNGAKGTFPDDSEKIGAEIPEAPGGEDRAADQGEHTGDSASAVSASDSTPSREAPVSDITGDVTSTQNTPHLALDPLDLAVPAGALADRVWPLVAVVVVAAGMILGYLLFT